MEQQHVHNNILQVDSTRYKNIGVRTEGKNKGNTLLNSTNQENKRAKIRGAEGIAHEAKHA